MSWTHFKRKKSLQKCTRIPMARDSPFGKAPHFTEDLGGAQLFSQSPQARNSSQAHHKTSDRMASREDFVVRKNTRIEPLLNMPTDIPVIIAATELKNVHPIIKGLFPIQIIREVPLAGRLQYFVNNWQILTKNPDILELVSGLRLSFIEEPIQNKPPHQAEMNMEQSALIDKEIDAMLRKGAIQKVRSQRDQFLSNLFLVEKKEGGNRPVINLKNLNAYLPYLHFKMEGPHLLKVMLQEKDYLCKVDLKDAYFCIPLHQTARKYVRFQWKGNIYQFLCLCFGLGPAPRLFTKLLKIPIALMRRLNVRIIIYLDDMLLMCQSVEKMLLARDTLLFLLQHLGFVINQTKSQLTPVQKIEFLGMEINSLDMTLNLPQQKVNSLIKQCQVVTENPRITVWRLSSLIGTLSSTAQAVLPAQLQLRYLQQQLIESLRLNRTYQSYTKSDFLAGNRMVDKQPSLDKWNVDSASNCENSHPNGCFHKGLGCPLLGAVSRGAMDFSGVQSTYQFIGTEGSTSCPSHLFKDQGYVCSTFANGQYDSPIISCQNGGYPQQRFDIHSEGNMGLSTQETDQNNCRISPRGFEYTSGHSVSTFPRLERMVAFSTSFSTNLSSVGPSGHGFVCLKTFPSGPSLYGLETRSIQSRHGCTTTKMVTSLPLCFPPIFSGWESGCKSQGKESLHGSDNSGLANTTVVRTATTNVSTDSNITATSFQLVSRSTGSDTPFSRKNLANEGVSERAAGLITNARRQGSLANYESSWGKWSGWCSKQQIDPFKCSINFVLDFLAELYDLDYKYSSINCHRSAISAYHDPIENVPVGQHPRVSSLMTGIFNQRPPQPRYSFVWDVEQVFSYLHNLPDNEQLSDRLLTLKLTMLLALASACRCSEIQNLDIRYMTRSATSYTFQFTKVSKSWKKGKPPPSFKFFQLESNRKLCVVSAIDIYLKRSLQWRAGSKHQLLLSTIQPHNEVAKSTISGWVKAVLENSGIDINIFKAHSSR